ncbi:hypothetical protein [Methylobacterium sp. WL19]|uniref:hypothetical protein n=1 Tax=Methylobacterium sp. WL19 TaxID=2603896 RepID=UPI0011C7181A|nr:hypothetical protein [Methylobacterium sp. WL19]TXN33927.1 hypothetical protein FV220_00320 [Methylobacterium sp. WL19]
MTTVSTASRYARRLVEGEARTTGQPIKEVAKHVATRLRQPYGSIWGLLFRSPKTVSAELLVALQEAVEKQVRLEIQALENELLAVRLGALRRDAGALEEIEEGIARLRARLAGAVEDKQ